MNQQSLAWGCWQGRGIGHSGVADTHQPYPPQYGDFNVEGSDLWLATSADQHVSVWASDWVRNHCELVDWLSFPAPTLMEVSVPMALQVGTVPTCPATAGWVPPQSLGCPPRPLAAFCPWDGALLVCAGLGVHPEVVFYSLRHKQARAPSPCSMGAQGWGGEGPRAAVGRTPGLGKPPTQCLVPAGGGDDPAAFLCYVPESVPLGPPHGHWLCW